MAVVQDFSLYDDYLLGRQLADGPSLLSDASAISAILGLHMVEERLARLEAKVEMLVNDLGEVRKAVNETRDYIMELRGRHKTQSNSGVEVLKWVIFITLAGLMALAGVRVERLMGG